MSNNFIGSKIAIITKTQCRYVGTIVGIDQNTSSILLSAVTCFGTENRSGNFATSPFVGKTVPLMQFANNDIEDLKIVDEEYIANEISQNQVQRPMAAAPAPVPVAAPAPAPVAAPALVVPASAQPSIHDDPAIVSAVVSSSNRDLRPKTALPKQLMTAFGQMGLSNDTETEKGFLLPSEPVEVQSSWPTIGSSKIETQVNKNEVQTLNEPTQNNKSRFFDQFSSKSNETFQSARGNSHQSNVYSNQANRSNHHYSQQQGFRSSNGNQQNSSRLFYNNHHRPGPGLSNVNNRRLNGNRETFQADVHEINDDFDFESNNRCFKKLTSEEEHEQGETLKTSQIKSNHLEQTETNEFQPIYDKTKSFFDNSTGSNTAEPMRFNRTFNQETFASDGYGRRPKNRSQNYNNRRMNNNQHRYQAQDDYFHRSSNNPNGNSYRH